MKRNSKLAEIRRNIRKLFNLRYFEVDAFVDDLLVNLETLNADINNFIASEAWHELEEASLVLQHVGENIQEEELRLIGQEYQAAAAEKNLSRAENIKKRFENLLTELGCTGIRVNSEET